MMDYSELTDDEIALIVGKRSGLCGFESEYGFDPCNDPSDAWPIILENEITIGPDGKAWIHRHCDVHHHYYDDGIFFNVCSEDKNSLRAAMIVYLMMGDDNA